MYTCDVCGRESFKKIRLGGYTLCNKHMHQLHQYGRFLDNNPRSAKDLNEYRIKDDIVIFDVYDQRNNKNGEFIIDLEDLPKVKYHKWRLSYGHIVTGNNTKTKPTKHLHHLILDIDDPDIVVDHKDGNPANNRKSNLRICTQHQNTLNKVKISNNTSGYIGVSYLKDRHCWTAEIRYNKRIHLGNYKQIEEAVYARYIAEVILFKEYRNTNTDDIKLELFKKIPIVRQNQIKQYITNKITN